VGTQGQKEGGRLVGGEVRAREGSFFFSFFFFFSSHVFVVKYKKQHGALAMAETKL